MIGILFSVCKRDVTPCATQKGVLEYMGSRSGYAAMLTDRRKSIEANGHFFYNFCIV